MTKTKAAAQPVAELNGHREMEVQNEWSEVITIDGEMARQWINEYKFDGNRPLSRDHLAFLKAELKAGRFRTSEIRLVHTPQGTSLTNGNHRLHLVAETGISIKANVYHLMTGFPEEVAEDYGATDQQRKRTVHDAVRATTLPQESGLNPTNFNKLIAATNPLVGGFTSSSFGQANPLSRSVGVRKLAIREWIREAHQFYDCTINGDQDIVKRSKNMAVMSVGLVAFRYQSDKAYEFWHKTVHNDGLIKGDPCRTLAMFLLKTKDKDLSPPVYARQVAKCWNAFYQVRNLQVITGTVDPTAPICIKGTPYNGKGVITINLQEPDDN